MKCSKCTGKMTSPATGHCSSCGAGTSNRQAKLCGTCSKKQNKCSQCLTDLGGDGQSHDGQKKSS
jgi:hypothetical protein